MMQEFFPTPVLPLYSARRDQVEPDLRACFEESMTILQPQQRELDLLIVILPENNGSLYGMSSQQCSSNYSYSPSYELLIQLRGFYKCIPAESYLCIYRYTPVKSEFSYLKP